MKIFRFEKNEAPRLETIKRSEIYLSSPESFNDLDDCRIQGIYSPNFDRQFHEKLLECVEILYPKTSHNYFPLSEDILNSLKEFFANCSLPDILAKDEIQRLFKRNGIVQKIREDLRKNTGICCFFKDEPTHPLMWAHYANSHTGFCIEYEINEANAELQEVNYASQLPAPSINELLFCPEESFLKILTTKTLEWSYEKEVRFIRLNALHEAERGKPIPLPSFMKPVRLIKGAKFDQSKNEEILQSLGLDIVLYKNI